MSESNKFINHFQNTQSQPQHILRSAPAANHAAPSPIDVIVCIAHRPDYVQPVRLRSKRKPDVLRFAGLNGVLSAHRKPVAPFCAAKRAVPNGNRFQNGH